jgi:E3 ubiquitin-protein ligase RAD18
MIKENPLRKKLTDAGLSAAGNRPLLERRYTEWITLWNANCDAAKPKSKGELKRELDIWEKTQGGRVTASSSSQMGALIKDKDFDGKAWSTKHDSDFQQLIANARRKVKVPSSTPTPSDPDGTAQSDVGTSTNTPDEVMTRTPLSDPIIIGDTPEKASQRIFFKEDNSEPPPSSQCQDSLEVLDKSAEITSDIATIRPMQP